MNYVVVAPFGGIELGVEGLGILFPHHATSNSPLGSSPQYEKLG